MVPSSLERARVELFLGETVLSSEERERFLTKRYGYWSSSGSSVWMGVSGVGIVATLGVLAFWMMNLKKQQ